MRKPRRLLTWLVSHQGAVLIGLAVMAALMWGFISLADEVNEGDTKRFDEAAVRLLRNPADLADPIGPPFLEEMGRDFTALGGFTVMSLVTSCVIVYLLLSGNRGTMWLIIAATLGAFLVSGVLKNTYQRPRPELVPHLSIVHTTSFPSGHSMNAAAVYLTLGFVLARVAQSRKLKFFFMLVAILLTLLVGASRVYMGVHYPTDVLAGWVAGLTWALACVLVTSYLKHRGKIEQNLNVHEGGTDRPERQTEGHAVS